VSPEADAVKRYGTNVTISIDANFKLFCLLLIIQTSWNFDCPKKKIVSLLSS